MKCKYCNAESKDEKICDNCLMPVHPKVDDRTSTEVRRDNLNAREKAFGKEEKAMAKEEKSIAKEEKSVSKAEKREK